MSKSREDFQSVEGYKAYLRIETAKSAICVLLERTGWKDYRELCKEAVKVGEAFVDVVDVK